MGPFGVALIEFGIRISMSIDFPVHLFEICQQFTRFCCELWRWREAVAVQVR
jgi:hypothetical protein